MIMLPMPKLFAAVDVSTAKEMHVTLSQKGMSSFKDFKRRVQKIKRPING